MSKSLNSPTARLLQNSRLFSLPRPLPPPALEAVTSSGIYRASDTATQPYPTHQAIVTTPSANHWGDWGLKRALPKKTLRKTSTPTIKVRAIDNAAHITDFGSAGDHVRTEAKWQEMGVPIEYREERKQYDERKTFKSVYDADVDSTDVGASGVTHGKRWKHSGSWLPGMTEGEFELYMVRSVATRKAEFRKFLVQRMLDRRLREEQRRMREIGETQPLSRYRKEELRQEVLNNFDVEEKKLRDEHASQHLGSELTKAITEFLDLPGGFVSSGVKASPALSGFVDDLSPTTAAPPTTHPGAGLSHIRTNAYMENHPLWGPQYSRSPVLARVLRPRNTSAGNDHNAKLGVGGIVTNDPSQTAVKENNIDSPENIDAWQRYTDFVDMTSNLDPDIPGGNHIWVNPETARIDNEGHIQLSVTRADSPAIKVRLGEVQDILDNHNAANQPMAPQGTAANANYGHGLSNYSQTLVSRRSRMEGFDSQLKDRVGGGDAMILDEIKELARNAPNKQNQSRGRE